MANLNALTDSEALDQFVNQLIIDKRFEPLEEDVVNQIKIDLKSKLEDTINAEILANFPPERIGDLNMMLDNNDIVGSQKLIAELIPQVTNLITATLVNFRKTYLNL